MDTFERGDVSISVKNSPTGLLMSAEIETPDTVITLGSRDKNRWEVVASWLRGAPEDEPADVVYNAAQKREVIAWAGEDMSAGHLYRAGLKMLAEQQGWSVSSARIPGS